MKTPFSTVLSLFCFATSSLLAWPSDSRQAERALDELRLEVSDLKYTLNSQRVELQILEEKLGAQEKTTDSLKKHPALAELSAQLSRLERKISELEKTQEKSVADLKQLSSHASQTSGSLVQYKGKIEELERTLVLQKERLDEVVKLKNTLSSISKAINGKPSEASSKSYKVKAGDSLEKIARLHGTNAQTLKKINQLSSDKIVVGQDIALP